MNCDGWRAVKQRKYSSKQSDYKQVYEMYGYVNRPEIKSNNDDVSSFFSKPQQSGDFTLLSLGMKKMKIPLKLRTLGEALNNGNGDGRESAARRLARIGRADNNLGNKVGDLLYLTLTYGTPTARAAAAETFARIGYSRRFDTVSGILIAMDDESPYVQLRAITALGAVHMRDKRLTSALFQCVGSPIDTIRHAAAKAINLTYRWRTARCVVHPYNTSYTDLLSISEHLASEKSHWVRDEYILAKKRVELEKERFNRHFLENVLGLTRLKFSRRKSQNERLE